MTPVLVLVLAVLALTLAYKGGIVITGMANAYNASYKEFNVTTGTVAPTVNDMTCYDVTTPSSAIVTLNAFSNVTVLCNATVSDDEGCQDYNGTLAGNKLMGEFYAVSKPCGAYNSKNCYPNATCNMTGSCVGMKNQTVECRFTVAFNANNTTLWNGWINVSDSHSLWANATDGITVDNLNALNVTNNTINLGTYVPGTNSTTHPNASTIQNGGNIQIDLNLNGTSTFDCATNPDIDIGNLTYNLSAAAAYGLTKLTTTATALSTFNLNSAAGGAAFPTATSNNLYWGIGVPLYTVGGQTCNATIRVAAIIDQ